MVKREIRGRYFVAFLLTVSIFVLGVFFGMIMSDFKTSKIYDSERELMTNFLVQDVQSELLTTDPCKFVTSGLVSQELFKVGDRLTALENELGKNNPQVLSLKRYYTILQLKDYLFFKKVNEKCNSKFILNLFFYSNDHKKCEKCEDQGFVLSYVRAKNDNIRTYSFDIDLEMPIVQYLTHYYNVTGIPSVVFNEQVYTGFVTTERAEGIIQNLK